MYQKFLLLNKMLLKSILKPKTCWKCWYVTIFFFFYLFIIKCLTMFYFYFFIRISKTSQDYNLSSAEPSTPREIKICESHDVTTVITAYDSVKQIFQTCYFLFILAIKPHMTVWNCGIFETAKNILVVSYYVDQCCLQCFTSALNCYVWRQPRSLIDISIILNKKTTNPSFLKTLKLNIIYNSK